MESGVCNEFLKALEGEIDGILVKFKLNYDERLIELVKQSNVEFEYLDIKNLNFS